MSTNTISITNSEATISITVNNSDTDIKIFNNGAMIYIGRPLTFEELKDLKESLK